MSIDEIFHPSYDAWGMSRMRDGISGSQAVKEAGEEYLLRPAAMIGREYDIEFTHYKQRADFLPTVKRTLSGYIGRAFFEEPEIEDASKEFLDSLDGSGLTFTRLLEWFLSEACAMRFSGALVDVRDGGPKVFRYIAEDVCDWHYDDGKLVYLKLRESYTEFNGGAREIIPAFRVFELDEAGKSFSILHEKNDGKWIEGEQEYPSTATGRIDYIPFEFMGDQESSESILQPLLDLALTYYDASAQYHWALSKVAAPTFVIEWDAQTDTAAAREFLEASGGEGGIKIGSGHALQLFGATARFAEVTGAGLGYLEKRLEAIIKQMVAAGARALADNSSNVSEDTTRIQNSGEATILGSIVGALEKDLERILYMVEDFGGGEHSVKVSRNFFGENITAADIMQLVSAWQSGGIPRTIVNEALRRGQWTKSTDEQLRGEIDEL